MKDIEECKLENYKPADDLEGVITDLPSTLDAVLQPRYTRAQCKLR